MFLRMHPCSLSRAKIKDRRAKQDERNAVDVCKESNGRTPMKEAEEPAGKSAVALMENRAQIL